ncbi:MAG: permease [Lentisphaerae bacterium]|nr:permease [Lentisphaerota bacterium]
MSKTAISIAAIWQVVLLMAPYLLLGFAVAGALSVVLTPAWVARHLGRRGVGQVVKAALLGVPLPLCSCGVIPLAFSLRKAGAGKGATVSFLASTPQTGVDSILLTYSLLGPIITVLRVAAAFVSGIVAGLLTDWVCGEDAVAPVAQPPATSGSCCCGDGVKPAFPATTGAGESCCEGHAVPAEAVRGEPSVWLRALQTGFVTLPRDMARPLILGVLISGVVSGVVPEDFFAGRLPPGIASYALALAIGIPIYVCSASSVPIAATFIHMGVSPGAAMVFLISGPATNAAGIVAMWRQIGRAGTAAYLGAIGLVSCLAGVLLDGVIAGVRESVPIIQPAHDHAGQGSVWSVAAAVLLLLLLLPGLLRNTPASGTDREREGLAS